MTTRALSTLLGCIAAFALVGAGCGGDDDGGSGGGTITIDGSSTVGPFATRASEDFRAENPDVRITVGVSGTGGGFERFCAGETDVSDASRPIDEDEVALCEESGVEYVELRVATDALTNIVNIQNDWATCLTVEQLSAIWKPGSKVSNWNQVDPSFPDSPLKLYGAGDGLGNLRLLHRRHQRRGGCESHRLLGERGRQRHRPGRLRRRGRPRLPRLLLLRGEPGQAQGARGRRRARVVSPPASRPRRTRPTRRSRDRSSCT